MLRLAGDTARLSSTRNLHGPIPPTPAGCERPSPDQARPHRGAAGVVTSNRLVGDGIRMIARIVPGRIGSDRAGKGGGAAEGEAAAPSRPASPVGFAGGRRLVSGS